MRHARSTEQGDLGPWAFPPPGRGRVAKFGGAIGARSGMISGAGGEFQVVFAIPSQLRGADYASRHDWLPIFIGFCRQLSRGSDRSDQTIHKKFTIPLRLRALPGCTLVAELRGFRSPSSVCHSAMLGGGPPGNSSECGVFSPTITLQLREPFISRDYDRFPIFSLRQVHSVDTSRGRLWWPTF